MSKYNRVFIPRWGMIALFLLPSLSSFFNFSFFSNLVEMAIRISESKSNVRRMMSLDFNS